MSAQLTTQRQYAHDLLTANVEKLADCLTDPDAEKQTVTRQVFGAQRTRRMTALAERYKSTRNAQKHGKVFLLPGILGSQLWSEAQIWLDILQIIEGSFEQLQVKADGTSVQTIFAPNYLTIVYGELELALACEWDVIRFPYDWRLEVRDAAKELKGLIDRSIDPKDPLYFVCHSMGSLVIRSMLQQFPGEIDRLERFIMLACPNYGTFAIPLLYFGLNDVFKMIALGQCLVHTRKELMDWVKEYVGTYEMLPFVGRIPAAARLCDPQTYAKLNPSPSRFDNAKQLQRELRQGIEVPPPPANRLLPKMTSIVGYGFPTACDVKNWDRLNSRWAYRMTDHGDGNIAHVLGIIENVPTYFVNEKHDWVPAHKTVIGAVDDILKKGETAQLPTRMPTEREASSFSCQIRALLQEAWAVLQLLFAMGTTHLRRRTRPDGFSWTEARSMYLLCGGRGQCRPHR